MKTCNCCGVEKVIVDFHKDKSRKDGLAGSCKVCAIARVKKSYADDPERAKTRVKNWIEANRDRHNQHCYTWVKKNTAAVNARTARRYASRKNATPLFVRENPDLLWMIEQAYEIAKVRTMSTGIPWEVDHIVPLRGKLVSGLHTPWNLQVVPQSENRRKSNGFEVN
jgi:5-methylcytosine-specific restriction endonuclease McrA